MSLATALFDDGVLEAKRLIVDSVKKRMGKKITPDVLNDVCELGVAGLPRVEEVIQDPSKLNRSACTRLAAALRIDIDLEFKDHLSGRKARQAILSDMKATSACVVAACGGEVGKLKREDFADSYACIRLLEEFG